MEIQQNFSAVVIVYVVHIIKGKISDDAVVIWQLPAFVDVESSRQNLVNKTLHF